MKTFEEYCTNQRVWLICYASAAFEKPVYWVWYTDTNENETDCLLTFSTGEIVTMTSLSSMQGVLLDQWHHISQSDRIASWLAGMSRYEPATSKNYDLQTIETALRNGKLSIDLVEELVNFINLADDYRLQSRYNAYLETYTNTPLLREVWDYFYDQIFWPRFTDPDLFELSEKPPLPVQCSALAADFTQLRLQFERNLKLA
jgi:hypothetical protein